MKAISEKFLLLPTREKVLWIALIFAFDAAAAWIVVYGIPRLFYGPL